MKRGQSESDTICGGRTVHQIFNLSNYLTKYSSLSTAYLSTQVWNNQGNWWHSSWIKIGSVGFGMCRSKWAWSQVNSGVSRGSISSKCQCCSRMISCNWGILIRVCLNRHVQVGSVGERSIANWKVWASSARDGNTYLLHCAQPKNIIRVIRWVEKSTDWFSNSRFSIFLSIPKIMSSLMTFDSRDRDEPDLNKILTRDFSNFSLILFPYFA